VHPVGADTQRGARGVRVLETGRGGGVGVQVDDHRSTARAQAVVDGGGDRIGVGTEIGIDQLGGAGIRLGAQRTAGAGPGVDRAPAEDIGRLAGVGEPFRIDHQPRECVDHRRRPQAAVSQCCRCDLVGGGVGRFVEFGGELDVGGDQVGADLDRNDAGGVRDVNEHRALTVSREDERWGGHGGPCRFCGGGRAVRRARQSARGRELSSRGPRSTSRVVFTRCAERGRAQPIPARSRCRRHGWRAAAGR
jgi:hypothetical protein